MDVFEKIEHKIAKWRLQPIRVFLFHQVAEAFDAATMKEGDYTPLEQMKLNIEVLSRDYTFISLEDAHLKLVHGIFPLVWRRKKYAVLTSDDGWASLWNILPWLKEKQIPITLFLNPAYLDGKHFRNRDTEKYLSKNDLKTLATDPEYIRLVSFCLHGWEHTSAVEMTEAEFTESVRQSKQVLQAYPNFSPFFAYTWGKHSKSADAIVAKEGLIPVLIDGVGNYVYHKYIHRELLDGQKL